MALPTDKHFTARIIERKDLSEDLWLDPCRSRRPIYVSRPGSTPHSASITKTSASSAPTPSSLRPTKKPSNFSSNSSPGRTHSASLQTASRRHHALPQNLQRPLYTRSEERPHQSPSSRHGHRHCPFVSYVRTLYKDWKAGNSPMPGEHKLFCLQGGSRSWEFGYREELERIAAEVPWFKYVATISRPWEDAAWKGQTGRVDDLVRMYADEWNLRPEATTGYLCGHPSMCENGMGILTRAGWQKGTLFEEVYFIPGKEVGA